MRAHGTADLQGCGGSSVQHFTVPPCQRLDDAQEKGCNGYLVLIVRVDNDQFPIVRDVGIFENVAPTPLSVAPADMVRRSESAVKGHLEKHKDSLELAPGGSLRHVPAPFLVKISGMSPMGSLSHANLGATWSQTGPGRSGTAAASLANLGTHPRGTILKNRQPGGAQCSKPGCPNWVSANKVRRGATTCGRGPRKSGSSAFAAPHKKQAS